MNNLGDARYLPALPFDYPEEWRDRFNNEQYLLLTYLLGGAHGDEILLPIWWASHEPRLHDILASLWAREDLFRSAGTHGGSFWMRRVADTVSVPCSLAEDRRRAVQLSSKASLSRSTCGLV
jgi:hypothetical protein